MGWWMAANADATDATNATDAGHDGYEYGHRYGRDTTDTNGHGIVQYGHSRLQPNDADEYGRHAKHDVPSTNVQSHDVWCQHAQHAQRVLLAPCAAYGKHDDGNGSVNDGGTPTGNDDGQTGVSDGRCTASDSSRW